MPVPDMIDQLAIILGLTRNETITAALSAMTGIGTLAAAFAAYRSSEAAAKSIQEMREGRLSEVRPYVTMQAPSCWWVIDSERGIEFGKLWSNEMDADEAGIVISNEGKGPAINVSILLQHPPRVYVPLDQEWINDERNSFEAGGMSMVSSHDALEFQYKRGSFGIYPAHKDIVCQSRTISVLKVGIPERWDALRSISRSLLYEALINRRVDEYDSARRSYIELSYNSLTGESFSSTYCLVVRRLTPLRRRFGESSNWSLEFGFSVSLYPERSWERAERLASPASKLMFKLLSRIFFGIKTE